MPIVMVVVLLGHEPHAPWSFKYTTGPSISDSSTLPPSCIRYGRICKLLHCQAAIQVSKTLQKQHAKCVWLTQNKSWSTPLTSSSTASTFSEVSSRLSAVAEHTTGRVPAAPQLESLSTIAYAACLANAADTGDGKVIAPHAYLLCLCSWVVLVVALLRLATVAVIEACTETVCLGCAELTWVPLIQKCWR